jgi:hypothetical protein
MHLKIPAMKPADTFSPIGGEGWDEGAVQVQNMGNRIGSEHR